MRGHAVRATAIVIAAGRRIRESRGKRTQPVVEATAMPTVEATATPAVEAADSATPTPPVRKRRTRKPKGTVSGGNGGDAGLPDGTKT
jgi:hypothetical protein